MPRPSISAASPGQGASFTPNAVGTPLPEGSRALGSHAMVKGTDRDTKGPDMSPITVQPPAQRRIRRVAAAALIAACTGIATGVAQAADTGPAPNTAKRVSGTTSVHGS